MSRPTSAAPSARAPRELRSTFVDRYSEPVEWQLVAALYEQTDVMIFGGVAMFVVALVAWGFTRQSWFLVWAGFILPVQIGRLIIARAFRHRREGPDRVRVWRTWYCAGTWCSSLTWGVAALVLVYDDVDLAIALLVLLVQTVIVMGNSARNAACLQAVLGQTCLAYVPIAIVAVVHGGLYDYTLAGFYIFGLLASLKLVEHFHHKTVTFLITEQENIALVDQVQRANRELADANTRLATVATTDALTGIANRRRFDEALDEQTRLAQRDQTDVTLLMLDIDNFKGYNDLYGHQAGDACLRQVAQTLAATLRRPADLIARYGGEEFAAILPQTGDAAAAALAESIRGAVESLGLVNAASVRGLVTLSIGVAAFGGARLAGPADLIRSADEALYAAKAAGRNCVRLAGRPALSTAEIG